MEFPSHPRKDFCINETVRADPRRGVSVRTVKTSYSDGSRSVVVETTDAATKHVTTEVTNYPAPRDMVNGNALEVIPPGPEVIPPDDRLPSSVETLAYEKAERAGVAFGKGRDKEKVDSVRAPALRDKRLTNSKQVAQPTNSEEKISLATRKRDNESRNCTTAGDVSSKQIASLRASAPGALGTREKKRKEKVAVASSMVDLDAVSANERNNTNQSEMGASVKSAPTREKKRKAKVALASSMVDHDGESANERSNTNQSEMGASVKSGPTSVMLLSEKKSQEDAKTRHKGGIPESDNVTERTLGEEQVNSARFDDGATFASVSGRTNKTADSDLGSGAVTLPTFHSPHSVGVESLVVAELVPEDDFGDDPRMSHLPIAVATRDSVWQLFKHNRRTQAGLCALVLALVGLTIGLVISNASGGGGEESTTDPTEPASPWVQEGLSMEGPKDSEFGSSVSLSAGGNFVAISAPGYFDNNDSDGNLRRRGLVQVYKSLGDGNEWTLIGPDVSTSARDNFPDMSSLVATEFGNRIAPSLSADGSRIAIGTSFHSSSSKRGIGQLEVFQYEEGSQSWDKVGQTILGENPYDYLGAAVSLSPDGNTVAVGAPGYDTRDRDSGQVQVFEYLNGNWTLLGSSIRGEAAGELLGGSVSLMGAHVAVGSVVAKGNSVNATAARLFGFENGNWTQKGPDITTEALLYDAGWHVSCSSDGNVIATSSYYVGGNGNTIEVGDENDLVLRAYSYEEAVWKQMGDDLHREDSHRAIYKPGYSVSLSADGQTIAMGDRGHSGSEKAVSGHAHFFNYNSGKWAEDSPKIEGESPGDQSGASISLSSDGKTVAIGAPYNRGKGFDHGNVRVFKFHDK